MATKCGPAGAATMASAKHGISLPLPLSTRTGGFAKKHKLPPSSLRFVVKPDIEIQGHTLVTNENTTKEETDELAKAANRYAALSKKRAGENEVARRRYCHSRDGVAVAGEQMCCPTPVHAAPTLPLWLRATQPVLGEDPADPIEND